MFPITISSRGGRVVACHLVAVLFLVSVLPAAAHAQLGACGTAAGYFQVDGQFYSSTGLTDWVQGTGGTGVFNDDGSTNLVPALYDRDPHWAGNAEDPDHFAGSGNKNNDDISAVAEPWEWGAGSGPAKNDLTDVYAHSAIVNDEVWLFLGAMTRANNGASHVDFEFNQEGFTKLGTESGTIVGNGDDAGRTEDVDFIISVDFESGGNVPVVSCRVWDLTATGYEFVEKDLSGIDAYVCTNDQQVPAPPWGAVTNGGSISDLVEPFQMVEIAVNLTGLGIDPTVFCSDNSTLLFKTRSSPSFTAELKDLALYRFSIFPVPDCTITADRNPLCEGESTQLCAPLPPAGADYTYVWDGPGAPYPDARCITVDTGGEYSLVILDNSTTCDSDTCRITLTVNPRPACTITADRTVVCEGETAQFCGPAAPPGAVYSYLWTGPGGTYPDQRCITVGTAGDYSLTVTNLTTGCVSASTCGETLTVNALPPNTITGSGLICQDSSTDLCGPEGDYRYLWTGPTGASTDRCLTTGVQGTYTLVVTSNATGCSSLPAQHEVIVADNPGCVIEGPASVCPDGEITLCGPEGEGFTYAWTGPGGPYGERCVTVTDPGTYRLTLTDGNGCLSVCEHTVTLDEEVTVQGPDDLWICTGSRAEFCVDASGTGPITYQWMKDGQPIDGATESCYVIPSVNADDVAEYSVTVTGKCNQVTGQAGLELADVVVNGISGLYLCEGQEARLCPDVEGRGPFTFAWTRDGVPVGTDSCLVIPEVTEEDEGEYCVTVTGYCGEPATACATVLVGDCAEFCGLTQGFWGNYGGKWNGMTTLELIDSLITVDDPLIIGIEGERSVTYPEGAEECVIVHLPGGGHLRPLPEDLGDVVVDSVTCNTVPNPLLGKPGRVKNNLYTQTVALSLNGRLDPNLSGMDLCEIMIMIGVLPGPDGLLGTPDDLPNNDDVRIIRIPQAVFDALTFMELPHTAGGLLTLAHHALAGSLPPEVEVTLGDITGSIGSVNNLVDRCAMRIHCENPERVDDSTDTRDRIASYPEGADLERFQFRLLSANPIRRSGGLRVSFQLPEDSEVRLALFDLSGRMVGDMVNRVLAPGGHELDLRGRETLATGIYFLRLEAKGIQSGKGMTESRKILMLP